MSARDWLIEKLGGVPQDEHDYVVRSYALRLEDEFHRMSVMELAMGDARQLLRDKQGQIDNLVTMTKRLVKGIRTGNHGMANDIAHKAMDYIRAQGLDTSSRAAPPKSKSQAKKTMASHREESARDVASVPFDVPFEGSK